MGPRYLLGMYSASGDQGNRNLMEIVGSPTSVGDIWSGLGSNGTNHSTRAVAAAVGGGKLTRDQHMLETFGPMLTSVGEVLLGLVLVHDIWSGSSSV